MFERTTSKAHQARLQAGWTSVPALVRGVIP